MGLTYFGVPDYLVLGLRNSLSLGTFIETGTNVGNTCRWAARHFDHVVSIEADERLYQTARQNVGNRPNVDLRFGASQSVLRSVVPALAGPALFWLDAHWCGPETAGLDHQCPVLEEIDAIDAGGRQHVILIDDARMFINPGLYPAPIRPEQWPSCQQVFDRLRAKSTNFYIAIQDDVIVRVPARWREALERLQKSRPALLLQGKLTARL